MTFANACSVAATTPRMKLRPCVWRGVFGTNTSYKDPASSGYLQAYRFQVQPKWDTQCDPSRPQSPHTGGINVLLGDGHVRFVNGSVSDASWFAACDPQDGNAVGNDW